MINYILELMDISIKKIKFQFQIKNNYHFKKINIKKEFSYLLMITYLIL